MPEISLFYGIRVTMYYDDHNPPHFHAEYNENKAIIEIDTAMSTTYYDGYGWDGELQNILPTSGYYYNSVVGSSSFIWNYTPTRNSEDRTSLSGSKMKK